MRERMSAAREVARAMTRSPVQDTACNHLACDLQQQVETEVYA